MTRRPGHSPSLLVEALFLMVLAATCPTGCRRQSEAPPRDDFASLVPLVPQGAVGLGVFRAPELAALVERSLNMPPGAAEALLESKAQIRLRKGVRGPSGIVIWFSRHRSFPLNLDPVVCLKAQVAREVAGPKSVSSTAQGGASGLPGSFRVYQGLWAVPLGPWVCLGAQKRLRKVARAWHGHRSRALGRGPRWRRVLRVLGASKAVLVTAWKSPSFLTSGLDFASFELDASRTLTLVFFGNQEALDEMDRKVQSLLRRATERVQDLAVQGLAQAAQAERVLSGVEVRRSRGRLEILVKRADKILAYLLAESAKPERAKSPRAPTPAPARNHRGTPERH